MDFKRLEELKKIVDSKKASKEEADEFVIMLYHNQSIKDEQYNNYMEGKDVEDILHTCSIVASIICLGYWLGFLVEKKTVNPENEKIKLIRQKLIDSGAKEGSNIINFIDEQLKK